MLGRKLPRTPRGTGQLAIQRLPVPQAAAKKLGPFRDGDLRCDFLREERPQVGVVPAKLVSGAVAMPADASAQTADFSDQLLPREVVDVFVHPSSTSPGTAEFRFIEAN